MPRNELVLAALAGGEASTATIAQLTGLSASLTDLVAQVPVCMRLIARGRVEVPTRTFPLTRIADAWNAAGQGGPRVVVVPG